MATSERKRRGRNSKLRGKAIERSVARIYDGQRMPDSGKENFDVLTDHFAIEVKSSVSSTPKRLQKAWAQACQGAERHHKVPLVILSYVDGGKRVFWEVQQKEVEDNG